ncbi:trehalose/maltose hydrolase-like predicted phosphorylase [Pontibacter aydingkolensis]|uniref:Glycoside hydrolase family 65 protein n=1 Tax=Pontibacter aydingkolensis TaxID=1911536 RepID=A0ABS7CXF7_9BACT|nr:glycosyl hydrolase family 65 protein [Pontibacter aydingkolensis]MBW7468487.1 glycoside hydrolase family 65 protein [Pontibacter aydingkolensis]
MSEWKITYDAWDPEQQPLREALCTLGNGHFATRGAFEEENADEQVHYPGTYLAGGYNRLVSTVSGEKIENEDLVNWPNWLPLSFRVAGEEWFSLSKVQVLEFIQELDMKQGLLTRTIRFQDTAQRETLLVSRRFVSMANPHLAAQAWELTPLNWSGEIEIRTALDGRVINSGVARYRSLESRHLEPIKADQLDEDTIYLVAQTTQSKLRMAQAARTTVYYDGKRQEVPRQSIVEPDYAEQVLRVSCSQKQAIAVEKVVLIYTSRDFAISEPLLEACEKIERLGGFDQLLASSRRAWLRVWKRCDLEMACNQEVQPVLRLHVFHLLQTVSANTVGRDVGVPARGWHGEAYRGHIFWDELFIFPFLNLRLPDLTIALLMYRYRRLPEARYAAVEAGYRGAMYPWQSGSNGREESQIIHLNPKSGRWVPDNTFLQRHINAAVAYNVWQYYQATHDREFLTFYGAEVIFEIAQFWSTIAIFSQEKGRYEIRNVVGPDEYHTEYPGSEAPGLNNNAYTNVMAVWVIQCALKVSKMLDTSRVAELMDKCSISTEDLERWQHISQRMYVPFIGESNVIAQFEGYEQLDEFPWEEYKAKYGEAMRLDRILESENDNVNKYKASKQADVLMLFYLFSSEELTSTFERMGYGFKPETIPDNIAYYEARTSHGSTLSKIVHSWVLARSDRKRSWTNFEIALMSDVEDIQGGTTSEGIHLGAMAGTVDLVQRCYTGLEIRDKVLWFNPVLPDEIECLNFQIRYRSHWLSLNFTHDKMVITFDKGWSKQVKIGVQGQVYTFKTGEKREFDIKRD